MYVVKCVACQGKKQNKIKKTQNKTYIFKYINDDFGAPDICMLLDYSLLICMLLNLSLSVNCLIDGGIVVALFLFLLFPSFFKINIIVKISFFVCVVLSLYVCIWRKIPFPTNVTRDLFTWITIPGHRCSLRFHLKVVENEFKSSVQRKCDKVV